LPQNRFIRFQNSMPLKTEINAVVMWSNASSIGQTKVQGPNQLSTADL